MNETAGLIEDGRAYGNTLAIKQILTLLERKGVLKGDEITLALDKALEELRRTGDRLNPEQSAIAGRAIGLLYVRE